VNKKEAITVLDAHDCILMKVRKDLYDSTIFSFFKLPIMENCRYVLQSKFYPLTLEIGKAVTAKDCCATMRQRKKKDRFFAP
jgi:hypothetical protein